MTLSEVGKGSSGIPVPQKPRVWSILNPKTRILITVVNLATVVVAWEVIATYADVSRLFLPKFSSVLAEFPRMNNEGILVNNLWISTRNYTAGMVIAILVSIPLGLLVGTSRILQRALDPYLWALYMVPRIVLLPLIILWAGVGDFARITLVVVSAAPVILLVLVDGLKTIDQSLVRAAKAFCASRTRLFMHVVLPSTVPVIGTGVRMGVSRGLIGLFVGELFTAANGMGYIIQLASRTFNTARMFAMVLLFVAFSVSVVLLTRAIERRLSMWRGAVTV